jgi:excinuclease ABC subunit A
MPIDLTGASEHNLHDVDVTFGDGLTVVTGVSGSGKTSLVFDTLYHEARRRFLEVFALGSAGLRLAPARVRAITGLGPAVVVGQNLLNRNPNSTLASASGLHPFLRLLYARFGTRHCAGCGAPLAVLGEDQLVERLAAWLGQGDLVVEVPLVQGLPGSHATLLRLLAEQFDPARLRVDGAAWDRHLLDPDRPHDIALRLLPAAGGDAVAGPPAPGMIDDSMAESPPAPSPARLARSLVETAAALGVSTLTARRGEGAAEAVTVSSLPVCARCGHWFEPLEPTHFHRSCPHCDGVGCGQCAGTGLPPAAAAVRWDGLTLPALLALPVSAARTRCATADLPPAAARLRHEIGRRLDALDQVGLGYIALDRPAPTLSRGEAQRVRLAVALTSRLEDMLHVLDEPTVGQHPADVARLLPAFRRLPGPVVFVEHDRAAAAGADAAVDLGPGAGRDGGRVVFAGTPAELWRADTTTGRYFSGRATVATPAPRPAPERFLELRGAGARNLRDIDVPFPLGRLTVVTGVSGSGKSTLVEDVLVASLATQAPVGCAGVTGPWLAPTLVTQEPIGVNPRSNPATYTKLADLVRDVFAAATGLSAAHFSFNRPEGACPACGGMGAVEVAMRYLPATWIPCAECGGRRFSDTVLAATADFAGRQLSVADLYELPVAEAAPLLLASEHLPPRKRAAAGRILAALVDVGLGYLTLGQPSPTLSGGEAQRVKLARHLGSPARGAALLVLDEPTTGLHPADVAGLLTVLDRLARDGATVVVVEHNTDVVRAADWVIDLGPGAGDAGGDLLYAGPPAGLLDVANSRTGAALRAEAALRPRAGGARSGRRPAVIAVRGARAHNLRDVDVDFPAGRLTVVTGVSGSGKSSLVDDVLEAEARRRFLETLTLYERQGTREGPEAPVDAIRGLGVAVTVSPERRLYDRRATLGSATEVSHHLAVLLALAGERRCLECGSAMARGTEWTCPDCGAAAPLAEPRHFLTSTYASACRECHGVGTLQMPNPGKLILHPDLPLCGGAMHSPGFFPKGYLCKPFNGGYDMVRAVAERYGFDPEQTPWRDMSPEARHVFLFGHPAPMRVTFRSRTGRVHVREVTFPGFYGWVRDWDTGGTYTDTAPCPACGGSRLRPEYLAVTLAGQNVQALSEQPLRTLADVVGGLVVPAEIAHLAAGALDTARRRLGFLVQVGLGYLHLNRPTASLSAGEAQRVRLAGLLGSGLTSLTVLLDEPTRGLHPSEVAALVAALRALRDEGNTVIVVEHDLDVMAAADHLIDVGPGAGAAGGHVVAQGPPAVVRKADTVTAAWLRGERRLAPAVGTSGGSAGGPTDSRASRRPEAESLGLANSQAGLRRLQQPAEAGFAQNEPGASAPGRRPRDLPRGNATTPAPGTLGDRWLTVHGARANNLRGDDVRLPLGALVGVCGVSGSGKSTLIIDTLGRALAPAKHTTSVAIEPITPGAHDAIEGAPPRVVVVDQTRAGLHSPAAHLGLVQPLRALYAASDDARALGLDQARLTQACSDCHGRGLVTTDMAFLPDVQAPCEACHGTGFVPEAWDVRVRGLALPEVFGRTLDEVRALFADVPELERPLGLAGAVGLGYLVLRQPGLALSGGEAQRLRLARELARPARVETLYILDEPTVGQHPEDVARLVAVLRQLVATGHTVLVVEHHPLLLAACDWLVELGPGGGPDGGRVIAQGSPATVADAGTPTAPCLRAALEVPA